MAQIVQNVGTYSTFTAVSIATVIVNAIEIALIAPRIKQIKPFEQFLLSLSVADLLVGLSTFIWTILWFATTGNKNDEAKATLPLWYSLLSSLCHVYGLTFDRYIAVRKPLKHNIWMTRSKTTKIILAIWIVCMVLIVPIGLTQDISTVIGILSRVCANVGGLVVFAYGYIIYKTITNRKKNIFNRNGISQLQQKRETRLVVLSCIVAFLFLALNLPFAVLGMTSIKNPTAITVTRLALVCNSLINPFVYFFWKHIEGRMKVQQNGSRISNATVEGTQ